MSVVATPIYGDHSPGPIGVNIVVENLVPNWFINQCLTHL